MPTGQLIEAPIRMPHQNGRVIVVGSTNTDLVVHCSKLPQAGETVLGGDMHTFAGGKGANQAVAAARAGAKVHFIGAFGDDEFGRARRKDLEKEGIDCSGCVIKKGVPSGVALIAIGDSKDMKSKAENQIVVAPGANARLTPEDVRRGMPKGIREFDVILCSLEVPFDSIAEALKIGYARAKTILNPAPFPARGLPEALQRAHIVTPNETEFEQMFGTECESTRGRDCAKRIVSGKRGPFHIFVTRGSKGAVYYFEFYTTPRKFIVHPVPSPRVTAIDTVGAGDCFNGCLAASFAGEFPGDYVRAVHFAVAAASIKVTRRGAQAGMPYYREILKVLRAMKLPTVKTLQDQWSRA